MYQEYFTITYILDNDVDKNSPMYNVHYVKHVDEFAMRIARNLQQMATDNYNTCAAIKYIRPTQYLADRLDGANIDNQFLNDIVYREVWVALDLFLGNNIFF